MFYNFLKQEKGFSILLFFGFVILVVILIAITIYNKEEEMTEKTTYVVKQGPLKISVSANGGIQATEKIIIKSQLEGRGGATVISLIDEGAKVKKGDLLIEMDASTLIERKLDLATDDCRDESIQDMPAHVNIRGKTYYN